MDALGSTSFDRYARYLYTYRLRTELLPSRALRILDVGDPYGTLALVFPDDLTVSIDLLHESAPRDELHQHLLGSGFALPFPDGAFDLVTAHDVLEHVPDARRSHFVHELLRVSSGPVVVAAPFADLRTSTCERIVNAYYVAHVGHSLEPLDEHAAAGLPDLEALTTVLDEAAVPHVVYSDGWLFHWLAFMLLKAHYVSLGAADLDRATDAAFNRLLREADARGPHYRRALILRPPSTTGEVFGPPPASAPAAGVEADRDLLERMAWELIGALPRGEDPSAPTSALRQWLQAPVPDTPEVQDLARSLTAVLDVAAETVAGAERRAQRTSERVSVTAVVLARDGGAGRRAAEVLSQMAGVDDVLLCAAGGDAAATTSPKVRVLEVDGDDVLQLAHAVLDMKSEAMLVVDPRVGVEPDLVAPLLAALDDPAVCIGYHRAADRAPVQAAGIRVDGAAALYVARELFVIGRDLYRAVGGLDGRFRSQLDDLDLGWRLNLYGHRVTTVGPATWGVPQSILDADVATVWAWIKNLDVTSLDKVLPAAVLHLAADGPTGDTDLFDGFETLLRGRAEVAQRRVIGDAALQARFGTLALAPADTEPARIRQRLVREAFPWPMTAAAPPRQSVLLMADEVTHERMVSLAQLVCDDADVTLATPRPQALPVHALTAVDELDVQKFLEHADVAIVPSRLVAKYRTSLEHWNGVVVVDLDDADDGPEDDLALDRGDVFLCSSPTQRDHWAPQLLRRGRGQRADDGTDQILLVVVTAPPELEVAPDLDRGARRIVIDLGALPPQLEHFDRLVVELAAATADLGEVVVVGDPDGRHRSLAAAIGPQGAAATVHASPTAAERQRLLAAAALVVRPTPRPATPSRASARGAIDALALGVPVVTTAGDPIGWLAAETGAGAVTVADAAAIVAPAVEALRDPVVASGWRAAAVATAKALADGHHGSSFRAVVVRPWRWRAAHAGGLVPLEQTPAVARLLDEREVEVTRTVTAAVTAELRAEHEDLVARTRTEVEVVRARLGEVEDELNRVRHEAHRLRSHPLVRIALSLRRLLRSR